MQSCSTALVVGSGFGGLAAAIRLSARGYKVQILEKLNEPGGRARVFKQDGFVFDAGPTVITAPFLLEELWQIAGRRLADDIDMRPVDPFYRIFFAEGEKFEYTGDATRMRAEVERLSPQDVAGYERFVAHSEAIFKVGFTQLAHKSFTTWQSMLRIVPQMVQLQSYYSVYGLVAKYIQDPRLRQVMSFHPLLVGGHPFSTTSIYTLILFLERRWGVHFPIGGTGRLVQGLLDLFKGLGGTVRYEAPVVHMQIENRRVSGVKLQSGEELRADIVVVNGDPAWTYKHLIPPACRPSWPNKRLDKARYSMSLFVWYFGTNRQYDDVAHHTIMLGPRYKELLDDIFYRFVLAEDFSLYVHRPTATDANLAPPGCDAFYVLSPVPHLDSQTDWPKVAPLYAQAIEQFLERTLLPNLHASIVTSKFLTPQHFYDDLWSNKGAAFGMAPILRQSAYFRPHNQSEDIDNLYFVGAGTHPGAGLPGVLSSARVLDELL